MKFTRIVTDFIPVGGPNQTVTALRSRVDNPEAPQLSEGWELTEEISGVMAVRGEQAVLIPWARIIMADCEPLRVNPLKLKAEGGTK